MVDVVAVVVAAAAIAVIAGIAINSSDTEHNTQCFLLNATMHAAQQHNMYSTLNHNRCIIIADK
eukprot:2484903-Lingulodinium_polyedra.AAC.1